IALARFLDPDPPGRAGALPGQHFVRNPVREFVCVHAPSFARPKRMAYETIDFKPDGAVARITLNRPDRLNSFTAAMHLELRDALANLGDARVVILTGAGRGFCAGQDLNDRNVAPGEKVDLGETVERDWNPLVRSIADVPQPVIARVNGVA